MDSMVKKIKEQKQKHYYCKKCKLEYKEKKWAEKCESWCKEHKSCNIEITNHAIK